jgi:hypothetical protein
MRSERGTALITALIMLTIMGLFLVGFQALNRNELGFAGYSRNSTLAFSLAEAGVQEGIRRLNMFGAIPGATCFVNSMAPGATCTGGTSSPSANTVVYQAPLASDPTIFPILSLGTSGGAPRGVRVLEQRRYKTGFGNTIVGPQVTFQGDASPIIGDVYSGTSIVFASYAKSPVPQSGATATNLVGPQILAGTCIDSNGSNPCSAGGPGTNPGPFTAECASGSTSEVAPTGCARPVDSHNNTLPVNWHPAVPLGMSSADFTTLMNHCYAGCPSLGITTRQATQTATGVTYTPVSYTPSYWSLSGANGKVWLAVATQAFCIDSAANTVTAPPCGGSAKDYGQTGSTTRFLDWGLVQDDLTRGAAQTLSHTPSCTAPCSDAGNQNGVRYVPLLPSVNVTALACQQNVDPGINVFDKVNATDGIFCSSPIQTVSGTTVTFSGTKSNPESLVIDNAGSGIVHINASVPGNSSLTCANTNFDNYNWGIIFATGDIDLTANSVFTGFIYTPGNVYTHGTVVIQGGIFSSNDPASGTQVNEVDNFGSVNFCAGSNSQLVLNPQFFTFSVLTWQDRPMGQP